MCPSVPPPPRWSPKRAPPPWCVYALPPIPCARVRGLCVRVAFKGAKGASVASCPRVRVPVRVCVCICAGGAGNARAGRAGVRCVPVPVRVGVSVPLVGGRV